MDQLPSSRKPFRLIRWAAAGHLTNDFYTAFLAPLLPAIMESLSINLTAAGLLSSISNLAYLFNPAIGYLADKKGARYFVIFAPALTATIMSLIGLTETFFSLSVLLFLAGFSSTVFHAAAPGWVAKVAEKRKGLGLSLFMAGGGSGRSLGAMAAVWAVGLWGLNGLFRMMFIGWGVSLILFFQLRKSDIELHQNHSLRKALPLFKRFFFPLALVLLLRASLIASLSTYLPTYLVTNGAPLWLAGAALSILEISGVLGALLLGPISDRVGRVKILNLSMLISSLLIPIFIQLKGWTVFPVLVVLGFFSISTGTLFMALVQDNFNEHRATGNSVYVLLGFLSRAFMLVIFGYLGDHLGMHSAYLISAGAALCSIPALRLLPSIQTESNPVS